MPNKLRVGVAIEETWAFFREIYADFQENFQVSLFERQASDLPIFNTRLNRYLFDRSLQQLLQSNDIVFFEWTSELLAAATQMPKTCGIVARMHRYEMYRWIKKINWKAVDRLIVVTEAKRDEFLSHFPEMEGKISIIPEAVSLDRFTPFEKPFTGQIGTLCTLIPRKRIYEIILAFAELCKEFPGLHLHVGGPEHDNFVEYSQALYSLVRRLKLQDKVIFYGKVDNPEHWYRNLDIFVTASYSEGLQVALLEAMACGIYSLSHSWEGVEELLPESNLFFSEHDLLQRLKEYLQMSEDERNAAKQQMLSLVSGKSDIQNTIQQIRAIVEEIGTAARAGASLAR